LIQKLSKKTVVRNVLLLTAGQALNSVIVQVFIVYTPIAVLSMGGTASLAGLGSALIWGGRLMTTFHMGRVMDRVGRRPVIAAGMGLAAAATATAALAIKWLNLFLFLTSLFVFGVGRGMVEFARVAVTDMLAASRRGLGTGVVLTGSVVGAVAAPQLINYVAHSPLHTELQHAAAVLNYSTALAFTGLVLTLLVWPDPLKLASENNPQQVHGFSGVKTAMKHGVFVAVLCAATATGVMVAVMSLNTVIMYSHNHNAVDISTVVMVHVIGMYVFAIPLGRLSDRLGRRTAMAAGLMTILAGVLMLPFSEDLTAVTAALFLVGLGWSAVWVASTAMIADLTEPGERGGVMGAADAATAGTSIILPASLGVVLEVGGTELFTASTTLACLPALALCLRKYRRTGLYSETMR